MTDNNVYDLIVLGGGPAGYLAGERAGEAGLKALVIEKRALGGVCLNEGCIPSKTFLHSAKVFDYARHGNSYGVYCDNVRFNHGEVVGRKKKVVSMLVSGVEMQLKRKGVTVKNGSGVIEKKTAAGFTVRVESEVFSGKNILIATGSSCVIPPIDGLKESLSSGFAVTNREIFDLKGTPKSLVVVGGGVVGLEMASYYNSAKSKVTVIEMLDRVAYGADAEISGILRKNYEKKGIIFKTGCKVTKIADGNVTFLENGKPSVISAEKTLVSIGRRPVTDGIGLENIGVYIEKGAVKTDERMKTNIPGVYAAGDVNGMSMLAHTAYREAEVSVNNILGENDIMNYDAIPAVIYTNPEVGCVGETEESAAKKGIDTKSVKLSMNFSGRYVAENEGGDGIIKLVMEKKSQRLIGAHIIGGYASEIIFSAAMMIETQMKIENIKKLVFPHPTVCEIIREAVFEL